MPKLRVFSLLRQFVASSLNELLVRVKKEVSSAGFHSGIFIALL